MELKEQVQDDVVILQPVGAIDTRTSFDFEQKLDEFLADGKRLIVIDFSEVGLLASSGIRVLLMLVKRLDAAGGSLALCALTDYVKTVLDISGLTAQFAIAASRDEALSILKSGGAPASSAAPTAADGSQAPPTAADGSQAPPTAADVELSKISSTTLKLLGGRADSQAARQPTGGEDDEASGLTQEIERLFAAPGDGDAEADDS